jgi:hypothetical protein
MDKVTAEYLELLQQHTGASAQDARRTLHGMSRKAVASAVVRLKREIAGDAPRTFVKPYYTDAVTLQEPPEAIAAPVRAKKVSYSLLLPPDMLEAIKQASDRDGSSVSQYIRTAVAQRLGREQ